MPFKTGLAFGLQRRAVLYRLAFWNETGDPAAAARVDAMSSPASRIFDDLGRLMTDAAGVASGMKREVDSVVKSQIERLLRDADVVTREEFEAVREMAVLAREENEALKARIEALEARLGGEEKPSRKTKG
jgi:BMFP domain-containing protein YqiC